MKNTLREIKHLIKTDFIIDKRSKQVFSNSILYMLNTVILCYYTLKEANIRVWYILFWIILLFAAINSVTRNVRNNNSTYRYIDIIAKPIPTILSRIMYNIIIVAVLGIIESIVFLLLTNNVTNYLIFLIIVIFGSVCLSSILTFLTSIADKAKSSISLVTILSCPLILPTILSLIEITIQLHENNIQLSSFIPIISLSILIITCNILLFPYIWRE